ncbi:hypothetical protein HZB89_02155 [archaeon]|nr:hypothetical protein [archaeon]
MIKIDLSVSPSSSFFSEGASQSIGNLMVSRQGTAIELKLVYAGFDLSFNNVSGLSQGNYTLLIDNNGLTDVNKTEIIIGVE